MPLLFYFQVNIMRHILLWTCAALSCSTLSAQELNDFDSFMKQESKAFNDFLDEANRDFLNFMRDPWKQLDSKKPLVKRMEPEPAKPIVYDEKTAPKQDKPIQLSIEEILDLSTSEDSQNPIMTSTDVDVLDFDFPTEKKPAKKKKPNVVVIDEISEADKPKDKTPSEPTKPTAPATPAKPATPTTPTTPTKPTAPASPLFQGGEGRMNISFGGTRYYMKSDLKGTIRLSGIKENNVADAYERLYKTDYADVIRDMKSVQSDLSLNDWGMFTLVRSFCDASTNSANESVVMQHFLLSQLGYKAKMARKVDNSGLMLFLATDCIIYGHPFLTLNGTKYYYLNGTESCNLFMCTQDAPQAKATVSMKISQAPSLKGSYASSVHQATGSSARVEASVPTALIDFYKGYPQCDYSVYVKASVNPSVAASVLDPLRELVKGKSEKDAANLLINFVQTGFKYATDDEQFGYEKPFFVEELFYYPSCDCEDRSILFSYLVRNILGLDVVLLDYPNHIATAVKFREDVGGDFLMVGSNKYIVCDPTYIGASIGMTMPTMKAYKPKVLKY